MSCDALLTASLSDLGYKRQKRNVYKAEWSTPQVEPFLYFMLYGTPKEFLAVRYGFRNPQAQSFSIDEIRKHGGYLFSTFRYDRGSDCSMVFSLGELAGWKVRASLYLRDFPESALADRIKTDIEQRLFPVIRQLSGVDHLVRLLLNDAEPCPWFKVNGAIRAAQIVDLARQLGWDTGDIRAALRPFGDEITRGLTRGLDGTSYIDSVVGDSARN